MEKMGIEAWESFLDYNVDFIRPGYVGLQYEPGLITAVGFFTFPNATDEALAELEITDTSNQQVYIMLSEAMRRVVVSETSKI